MLLRAGGGGDPAPGRNHRARGPTGKSTQPKAQTILLSPPQDLRLNPAFVEDYERGIIFALFHIGLKQIEIIFDHFVPQ